MFSCDAWEMFLMCSQLKLNHHNARLTWRNPSANFSKPCHLLSHSNVFHKQYRYLPGARDVVLGTQGRQVSGTSIDVNIGIRDVVTSRRTNLEFRHKCGGKIDRLLSSDGLRELKVGARVAGLVP
jgi:hypothetical protein